jgi:hypothetical protein
MNEKLSEILEDKSGEYTIEKNPLIGEILEEKNLFYLINFEDEVYKIHLDYVVRNKFGEILFIILNKRNKNLEIVDHFLNKNGIKTFHREDVKAVEEFFESE